MHFLVVAVEVDVLATAIVGFVAKDTFAERRGLSTFICYYLLLA